MGGFAARAVAAVLALGWLAAPAAASPQAGHDADVVLPSAPTSGQPAAESPSGFDPLGLVWGAEMMRSHTLGADVAEVFVCSPPAGPEPMSMSAAVSLVAQAGGLFERASGGRYLLGPVPGSTVRGGDPTECVSEASERSAGAADLAVVVGVCDHLPGGSGPGGQPGSVANGLPSPSGRFPGSGRWVFVPAGSDPGSGCQGGVSALAHGIGHSFYWPHSDAHVAAPSPTFDLMSVSTGVHVNPFLRYVAGWLDTGQVQVWTGGEKRFVLGGRPDSPLQMVVIPSGRPGSFYVVFAVTDAPATSPPGAEDAEGVFVLRVDQGCTEDLSRCDRWGPWMTLGFVNNLRAEAPSFSFDVGDSFASWKDPLRFDRFSSAPSPLATVEVVGRADDGFVVEVFEPHPVPDSGRFVDVAGSVFEADVSELARLGVTRGCNPPANDRFCPDAPVTRGQMAAFLVRALRHSSSGAGS